MKQLSLPAKLILLASLVTNIGAGIQSLALGKLLYANTGSIAAFGSIIILEYFTNFTTNLLAGPLVDRLRARRLALIVDFIRGSLICAISIVLAIQYSIYWVALITIAVQVGRPFYKSALFRLQLEAIPSDQLARFNGFSSSSFQAGQLIGIALAGVLLEYYAASVALFVNGLSFALAGFIIRFVSIKHSESKPSDPVNDLTVDSYHRRMFGDWADVARYLLGNRLVIALIMISSLDSVMASMANIYLVPLVEIQHGGSGFWLALCDGLFAVGALLSGFLVTRVTDQIGYISAALLGFVFQSIAFLLLASSEQLLVMPSAMFVLGFFNTISWTSAMTLLQLNIDKNYRGRIALVRYMSGALFGAIAIGIITTVQMTSLNLAIYASAIIGLAFCIPPLLMLARKKQLATE